MKTTFTVAVFLLFVQHGMAQGAAYYQRSLGAADYEMGGVIANTADKGYIMAGSSQSFQSKHTDIMVTKFGKTGKAEWISVFGTRYYDYGKAVLQAMDGNYVIAGLAQAGPASVDPLSIVLTKLDSAGNTIWTKATNAQQCTLNCMIETNDGGYILGGSTKDYGAGGRDGYLVKFSANGDLVWTRTFGGALDESVRSLCKTYDGGFAASGVTYSFNDPNGDICIVKFDSTATLLWERNFGGPYADVAYGITEASNKDLIVAGLSALELFWQDYDGAVIRVSKTGVPKWVQTFASDTLTDANNYNAITMDASGNIILAGYIRDAQCGRIMFSKLAGDGTHIKSYKLDNGLHTLAADEPFAIIPARDGGFLSSGEMQANDTDYQTDFWIGKLDSSLYTCNSVPVSLHTDIILTRYAATPSWGSGGTVVDTTLALRHVADKPTDICLPPAIVSATTTDAVVKRNAFGASVYPNPVTDNILWLSVSNAVKNISVAVVSMEGNIQLTKTFSSTGADKYKIDVSALHAGMYLLKINAGTSQQSIPFIKR